MSTYSSERNCIKTHGNEVTMRLLYFAWVILKNYENNSKPVTITKKFFRPHFDRITAYSNEIQLR